MEKFLIKKTLRKIKKKKTFDLKITYSFLDKKINKKKISSKYKSKICKYAKFT